MRQSAALDEELRNIVDHAEALLEALADEGDAKLAQLRERVSASIDAAKSRLDDLAGDAGHSRERAAAAAACESWMRENPWTLIAIGAGVGLAAGWLVASRGRRRATSADTSPA
jgi:ElaB/YqjD/DUF883 family membrane-anchored ribosome-binding protein